MAIEDIKEPLAAKLRLAFIAQEEYFKCHYETDLDHLYHVRSFQLRCSPISDCHAVGSLVPLGTLAAMAAVAPRKSR